MRAFPKVIANGLCLALLVAGVVSHQVAVADDVAQFSSLELSWSESDSVENLAVIEAHPAAPQPQRANFEQGMASQETRHLADWVVDSRDNLSMPFAIVDKKDAKVYIFHADGRLRGTASVLLGLAVGDDSVPGIGDRKLSSIRPDERTTPAGRFVVSLDRNIHGKEILWVDYDDAISLHPVVTSNPKEHRVERLTTPTPLDNRISYGCINVPAEFFKSVVSPAFTGTNGIVYVLPETRSAQQVFGSYDVDERAQPPGAGQHMTAQIDPKLQVKDGK